jgi:23S rRNA pseudouridine1911/1915/1917 synthase
VAQDESGRRLDLFLAERLGLSRAQTRRLLARGAVAVEGRTAGAAAKGVEVRVGDTITVAPFTAPGDQRPLPEPGAELRVLAEGEGWLAVDKPPGVPVHPLREDELGTLLNRVIARHPEIGGVGEGALRSGVVHRLDVDTSGVVLFATTEARWQALRRAFSDHVVEKVYRAVVRGRVEEDGVVELPLLTARHKPAKVRVATDAEVARSRGVRPARIAWRVLERFGASTLVEVRPVTGFLHQIRAVFAHLGHPLLGDATYGDGSGASRHLLHASRVCFEDVAAECDDAPDFAERLADLRAAREPVSGAPG